MDASPHLMAPTHEEEFKGDKRLARLSQLTYVFGKITPLPLR